VLYEEEDRGAAAGKKCIESCRCRSCVRRRTREGRAAAAGKK